MRAAGLVAAGAGAESRRGRAVCASCHDPAQACGLCGPLRSDLAAHPEYCGRFRTPSLRNVALRQSFFHNGAIHTLADAVRFYVQRDTDPARWYGREASGNARRVDDLPARYRATLNTDPAFGGAPGDAPALSQAEIDADVAFLETLTDADQLDAAAAVKPRGTRRLESGARMQPRLTRCGASLTPTPDP